MRAIVGAIDRRTGSLATATQFTGTLDSTGEVTIPVSGANTKTAFAIEFTTQVDGAVTLQRFDISDTDNINIRASDGGYVSDGAGIVGYYV